MDTIDHIFTKCMWQKRNIYTFCLKFKFCLSIDELKEQLVDSAAKFIYTTNDRIATVQEATKDISLFKVCLLQKHLDRWITNLE